MKWLLTCLCVLIFPVPALSDEPEQQSRTCPVGGETFRREVVPNCTETGKYRMSLAALGTCETANLIPQCPANFLPLYKDFSDQELENVREFMRFETYDSAVDQSRYYLAYLVERYIGQPDSLIGFSLLLEGLWKDPDHSWNDPVYLDAFTFEATGIQTRVPPQDLPFYQAMLAFVYIKLAQPDKALPLLQTASQAPDALPLLTAYITSIKQCANDPASPFCNPMTVIPAN